MSVEIFNFKSLKKANEAKTDKKEEEHVTPLSTEMIKCSR